VPFDGYTAVAVRTDRQYVDTVDKYPKVRIRGQNPRTRLTPTLAVRFTTYLTKNALLFLGTIHLQNRKTV